MNFGYKVVRDQDDLLVVKGWDMFLSLLWAGGVVVLLLFGGFGGLFAFLGWGWGILATLFLCGLALVGFRFRVEVSPQGIRYVEHFVGIPYKRRHLPLSTECSIVGIGDWGDTEEGAQATLFTLLEQEGFEGNWHGAGCSEWSFGPFKDCESLAEMIQRAIVRCRPLADGEKESALRRGLSRPLVAWIRSLGQRLSLLSFRVKVEGRVAHWKLWNPSFPDFVFVVTLQALLLLLPLGWWGWGAGSVLAGLHLLLAQQQVRLEGRRVRCWHSRWWIPFAQQQLEQGFRASLDQDWEWPDGKEITFSSSGLRDFDFVTIGRCWYAKDLLESCEDVRAEIQHSEEKACQVF